MTLTMPPAKKLAEAEAEAEATRLGNCNVLRPVMACPLVQRHTGCRSPPAAWRATGSAARPDGAGRAALLATALEQCDPEAMQSLNDPFTEVGRLGFGEDQPGQQAAEHRASGKHQGPALLMPVMAKKAGLCGVRQQDGG